METRGHHVIKAARYEQLLLSAQKANAAPEVIAKYAFLFQWSLWKYTNQMANGLSARYGRAKVNKAVREHGHRMAFHHNQLKRMEA